MLKQRKKLKEPGQLNARKATISYQQQQQQQQTKNAFPVDSYDFKQSSELQRQGQPQITASVCFLTTGKLYINKQERTLLP